jgi:peroxiredoxin
MRLFLLFAFLMICTIILTKHAHRPAARKHTPSEFAGVSVEQNPANGQRAMRVKFTPQGAQLAVYLSYFHVFDGRIFGVAKISDIKATFTLRQDCAKRFQTPGYSYDNPGQNVWSFSLEATTERSSSRGPRLFHTRDTKWTSPCGGHPIGTERNAEMVLERVASLTGQVAPDFTLADLDGHEVKLSGLRGKVVVLDFWATWCGPCRHALPFTELLHRGLKDKALVVLGVDNEPAETARRFVAQQGYTFPTLLDPKDTAGKLFHIEGFPTTIVIDWEGKVAYYALGHDPEMLHDVLQELGAW